MSSHTTSSHTTSGPGTSGPGTSGFSPSGRTRSRRARIAALSWLVGGLSLACVGIGHAVATGPSPTCTRDAQGNQTCVSSSETTYTSSDGTHHLHQRQECTSVSRDIVETPETSVGQTGTTQIGAVVGCSGNAPVPN